MTKIIDKTINVVLWWVVPFILCYFAAVMNYDFIVIKFLEPIKIVSIDGSMVTYGSRFIKYRDLPALLSINFIDDYGNIFIPKLENDGRRNNPPGENKLLASVNLSSFKPKGRVVMHWVANYSLHFPLYERVIIIRQKSEPFCYNGSCGEG